MTDTSHPPFGIPWAAKGEERPSRFRTPLAYAPGDKGGAMFIRDVHGEERWITMTAWNEWARDNEAAPVKPEPPGEPPFDETAGA